MCFSGGGVRTHTFSFSFFFFCDFPNRPLVGRLGLGCSDCDILHEVCRGFHLAWPYIRVLYLSVDGKLS